MILTENSYNMDETGILLSVLNSIKDLAGKNELRNYKRARIKRILIIRIEYISGGIR